MRCLSCLMLGCTLLLPVLATEADAGFRGRVGYGPGLTAGYGLRFPGRPGFRHRSGFYGRFIRHKSFAGRYGFRRFGYGRYGAPFYGFGGWPGVLAPEVAEPDLEGGRVGYPLGDPYANVPGIPPSPVAPPLIYVLDGHRASRPMRTRKAPLRFGGAAAPYAYDASPHPDASPAFEPGSGPRVIRVIAPGR